MDARKYLRVHDMSLLNAYEGAGHVVRVRRKKTGEILVSLDGHKETDVKTAREKILAIGDPRPRVTNPGRKRHSAKWDRCVADVRAKGGAAVPEAVCTKVLGTRAYNPRNPDMAEAAKLYESFREDVPRRVKKVGFVPPRVVVDIGHVEYIGYRTTHGRKVTLYQHDFAPGSRPLLCVSPDGRQLMLLGGRYKFTDRGIVDRDVNDQEIENEQHGEFL